VDQCGGRVGVACCKDIAGRAFYHIVGRGEVGSTFSKEGAWRELQESRVFIGVVLAAAGLRHMLSDYA
jgi:hypothetical protein